MNQTSKMPACYAFPEVVWERTIYKRAKAYVHRYQHGGLTLIYAVVGGRGGCRKFQPGAEEKAIAAGIEWMNKFEKHNHED